MATTENEKIVDVNEEIAEENGEEAVAKLGGRDDALSKVGTLLKGLSNEYVSVACEFDDQAKYYTVISKTDDEGNEIEYAVVEDTKLEALEKEQKALDRLAQVEAIPVCDEKYIANEIEKTGKDAEEIVGEYLDILSAFLLNGENGTLSEKD